MRELLVHVDLDPADVLKFDKVVNRHNVDKSLELIDFFDLDPLQVLNFPRQWDRDLDYRKFRLDTLFGRSLDSTQPGHYFRTLSGRIYHTDIPILGDLNYLIGRANGNEFQVANYQPLVISKETLDPNGPYFDPDLDKLVNKFHLFTNGTNRCDKINLLRRAVGWEPVTCRVTSVNPRHDIYRNMARRMNIDESLPLDDLISEINRRRQNR